MKALLAAEGTTHERRRRSHLVKFVAVVTERGGDVNAPSLAGVCAYLSDFFERNGSANSLDKVLSFLRCGYTRAGLPWLSYAEAETLKRIMKIWKEEHGKELGQSVPITSRVLARWLRALPHTTADPSSSQLSAGRPRRPVAGGGAVSPGASVGPGLSSKRHTLVKRLPVLRAPHRNHQMQPGTGRRHDPHRRQSGCECHV